MDSLFTSGLIGSLAAWVLPLSFLLAVFGYSLLMVLLSMTPIVLSASISKSVSSLLWSNEPSSDSYYLFSSVGLLPDSKTRSSWNTARCFSSSLSCCCLWRSSNLFCRFCDLRNLFFSFALFSYSLITLSF